MSLPADDRQFVPLRPFLTGSFILLSLIATPVASARSWADASITRVINAGILPGETKATYGPARALDHGTLAMLVWGAVPDSMGRVAISTTDAPVTIGELDKVFVVRPRPGADREDGARPARPAALQPARRRRHRGRRPAARPALQPSRPAPTGWSAADTEVATRADAAYTTARVLAGVNAGYARSIVAKFAGLPVTTGQRHAALARAIRLIGMPYVWGGTNDKAIGQAHGGYDCSGLVWRALILDPGGAEGDAEEGRRPHHVRDGAHDRPGRGA